MTTKERRRISVEVNVRKVEVARGILGTRSLADTVDAALDEVVKLRERQRLAELLFEPGAVQLNDPNAMAGAWH